MTPTHATLEQAKAFTADLQRRFSYVTDAPLVCTTYRNAIVTPRRYFGDRTFVGAVYDAQGQLIRSTLRHNEGDIRPADPQVLDEADFLSAQALRRPSAIYGGIMFPILGHFLVETLARFWPLVPLSPRTPDGSTTPVCFHHWPALNMPDIWGNLLYRKILGRFGLKEPDVILVDRPTSFDTLILPEPASIYHERLDRQMTQVYDHIVADLPDQDRVQQSGRCVYLSRSRWTENRRIQNEQELEEALARRGVEVVHPQLLSPDQLLMLLRAADGLIAVDGSQAHLALFCRPGTRLVMLDTRLTPTQIAIEALMDLRSVHIPLFGSPFLIDSQVQDVEVLASVIMDAGLKP